jgi:recombination protein RecA
VTILAELLSVEEKLKAFKTAIKKEVGIDTGVPDVAKLETGIASLDVMLNGGMPVGRFIDLYGMPMGGKSTLSLAIAAEFQKIKPVLYIDVEASFGEEWAAKQGLDVSKNKLLIYSAGASNSIDDMSAEAVMTILLRAVESGAFSLVIVDSIAALSPEENIKSPTKSGSIGSLSRVLSQRLPLIKQKSVRSNTSVLFINQQRANISMGFGSSPTKATGGNALNHYDDLRLRISRMQQMKNGTEIVGHLMKVFVEKSKVSIPMRTCTIPLIYEFGISKELALFDTAIELGIIKRKGSYFTFNDKTFQGRENFLDELIKSRETYNEIKKEIYQKYVYVDKEDSESKNEDDAKEETKEKEKQSEMLV